MEMSKCFPSNSSRILFLYIFRRTSIERSYFPMGRISKFYSILYLHDNGRMKEEKDFKHSARVVNCRTRLLSVQPLISIIRDVHLHSTFLNLVWPGSSYSLMFRSSLRQRGLISPFPRGESMRGPSVPKSLWDCWGGDDLSPGGSSTVNAASHFDAFPFPFSRWIAKLVESAHQCGWNIFPLLPHQLCNQKAVPDGSKHPGILFQEIGLSLPLLMCGW